MFATIFADLLIKGHDLIHSIQIWERLANHFNTVSLARAMDIKCMLSTVLKDSNQSMDDFLRGMKQIVDSLASIWSLICDIDLVILTIK